MWEETPTSSRGPLASRLFKAVNTVSPGYTITDMLPADPAFRRMGEQASPLKRLGTPEDIADVVAFVVSEEARWLTGQNIHAGGGVVM
ncbi:MAG: SDR family oxidoreductase [Nitrospirota bacterium]